MGAGDVKKTADKVLQIVQVSVSYGLPINEIIHVGEDIYDFLFGVDFIVVCKFDCLTNFKYNVLVFVFCGCQSHFCKIKQFNNI